MQNNQQYIQLQESGEQQPPVQGQPINQQELMKPQYQHYPSLPQQQQQGFQQQIPQQQFQQQQFQQQNVQGYPVGQQIPQNQPYYYMQQPQQHAPVFPPPPPPAPLNNMYPNPQLMQQQQMNQVNNNLSRHPQVFNCHQCKNRIQSSVFYKAGTGSWIASAIMCCAGLNSGCCLIPFFVDDCKDAIHKCPHCGVQLGQSRFLYD